jgi:DnaJ-class molecular chaperone
MVSSDHYQILGVSIDASTREITSAYRKLALQYHPDRNKSPHANEMMLKINTAYGILSDPHKREQYDYSIRNPKVIISNASRPHKSASKTRHQRLLIILLNTASILALNSIKTFKSIIKLLIEKINEYR